MAPSISGSAVTSSFSLPPLLTTLHGKFGDVAVGGP